MTIGQRLDEVEGFGPGFDFLRIFLAVGVVLIHAPLITGTWSPLDPVWMFRFSILPMFFALSGFLIAGSAQRLVFSSFVLNRGFRILPALAVEIVLSALVLGPLVTTYDLASYFSDERFFRYFLSIVGLIQYELPGVFQNAHYTRTFNGHEAGIVNGSLWTVPHEMFCYLIMSAIILLGLLKRPFLVLSLTIFVLSGAVALQTTGPHPGSLLGSLTYTFADRGGARLIPAFLAGLLLYQFRYAIPFRWPLVVGCFVGLAAIQLMGTDDWVGLVLIQAITVPMLAYITVFLGLTPLPKLRIINKGDYSYGIYLYSCPIQQTLNWLLPDIRSNAFNFLASLALTALFAAFSWHFIEKPALKLRKSFSLRRPTRPAEPLAAESTRLTIPSREIA